MSAQSKHVESPTSPTKKNTPSSPIREMHMGPQRGPQVLARVAEKIPDDADAADTFYSEHDDFESGSDSGEEVDKSYLPCCAFCKKNHFIGYNWWHVIAYMYLHTCSFLKEVVVNRLQNN